MSLALVDRSFSLAHLGSTMLKPLVCDYVDVHLWDLYGLVTLVAVCSVYQKRAAQDKSVSTGFIRWNLPHLFQLVHFLIDVFLLNVHCRSLISLALHNAYIDCWRNDCYKWIAGVSQVQKWRPFQFFNVLLTK